MNRQNLTLQLPKELILKAKVLAAQRQTSVSGLVASELERLVGNADRYQSARVRALATLRHGFDLGGPSYPRRETLHDRTDRPLGN